jgi:hypothetical protein
MTQGLLSFKYETEKKTIGITALGGLPTVFGFSSDDRIEQIGTKAYRSARWRPGLDG